MNTFISHLNKYGKCFSWAVLFSLFSGGLLLSTLFLGELKGLKFIGQDIQFQNTITVSGKGEVTAIPDTSKFSFAVIEEAETVEEAQDSVTKTMNALLDFLEREKIKEKDVKTTSYSISPRYEFISRSLSPSRFPPGERELAGYEVSHWVEVTVREPKDIGGLISKIGEMGATNISNIQFTIDDEEEVKREARERAIKDAKDKAKALARDLDVSLIQIVSFNESGGPVYYREVAFAQAVGGSITPDVVAPEIPRGENTITSNVTIVYAIK